MEPKEVFHQRSVLLMAAAVGVASLMFTFFFYFLFCCCSVNKKFCCYFRIPKTSSKVFASCHKNKLCATLVLGQGQ